MRVEQVNRIDKDLLTAVNALLPQLSTSASPLTHRELTAIVESDSTRLLVAMEDGKICGMLTLTIFRIPTGVRSWIEDVVVDSSSRGKSVGKALLETAFTLARKQGVKTLSLTSNPLRKAAHHLYRHAGFEQRDTNVFTRHL